MTMELFEKSFESNRGEEFDDLELRRRDLGSLTKAITKSNVCGPAMLEFLA